MLPDDLDRIIMTGSLEYIREVYLLFITVNKTDI